MNNIYMYDIYHEKQGHVTTALLKQANGACADQHCLSAYILKRLLYPSMKLHTQYIQEA